MALASGVCLHLHTSYAACESEVAAVDEVRVVGRCVRLEAEL